MERDLVTTGINAFSHKALALQLEAINSRPMAYSVMEIEACLFKCKQCGKCCTDIKGVAICKDDMVRLSKFLGHGKNWFEKNMTEPSNKNHREPFIKGTGTNHRCPYYKNGCSVYNARPAICHLYPLLNPENGGMNPHFYYDCPGVVEWMQEIQAEQLVMKTGLPDMDHQMIYGVLRVIAFVRFISTTPGTLFENQLKKYDQVVKMFGNWNKIEPYFKKYAIQYLAHLIPKESIDEGLYEVFK
jgi:Fe-S-cluster containining protein